MYIRTKATPLSHPGKWYRMTKAKWAAMTPANQAKYETKPEGKSPKQLATNQLRQLRFHLAAAQGQLAKVNEIFGALDASIKDKFVLVPKLSDKFDAKGKPITFTPYADTRACSSLSQQFLQNFADSLQQLNKKEQVI